MLKIKKLQIQGFKSFCERTELLFPGSGVVGIVGPNGCGKSNVSDAICWVLGEQSVKSLRGQRMEDVIFAGSRERPATGMAEVSLTLVDPEVFNGPEDIEDPPIDTDEAWEDEPPAAADAAETHIEGEAPMAIGDETTGEAGQSAAEEPGNDGGVRLTIRKRRRVQPMYRAGEVVVTRRLYRDGNSEYRLNGRPCRLRDIQDIFMGTGLGPETYAIIEQGRIGQILSSKPYERRGLIEEAAGVTKYKAKKKLAEARLESARQNLARIHDIFEEVTRQMNSLKRQAAKARRYRELKDEYDARQRAVLAARAALIVAEETQAEQERQAAQAGAEAGQRQIELLESERGASQRQALASESALRQAQTELHRLELEAERLQGQLALAERQEAELTRRMQEFETALAALAGQQAQLESENQAAQAELAAAERELETARTLEREARAAGEVEAGAVAELEAGIETARQTMLRALNRATALRQQIGEHEALAAAAAEQLSRQERELTALGEELEGLGQRRGQMGLSFETKQRERDEVRRQAGEAGERLRGLRGERQERMHEREELQARLAEASARRRSLEEMIAHHGYSSEAVRSLFSGGEGRFRPQGVLADFLEVEPEYEAVVEEFLREELNYVVVEDWAAADAGLGVVRQDAQGRVTFLVHPDDAQLRMFSAEPQPGAGASGSSAEAGRPLPLRQFVRVLNGFGRSLEHILPKLGSGYIAAGTEEARGLSRGNPQAYFLTAGGEWFHNLTVSGGTRSNAGPLTLKRELRETTRLEAQGQQSLGEVERRLMGLEGAVAAAESAEQALEARAHELERELAGERQGLEHLGREAARLEAQRAGRELEFQRARAEQRTRESRMAELRSELEPAEAERQAATERERQAMEGLQIVRQRRETAAQRQAAAAAATARLEERAQAAARPRERLAAQLGEIAAQQAARAAESDAARQQAKQLETDREAARQALAAAAAASQQQATLQAQAGEQLELWRGRAAEVEPRIQTARQEWEAWRERQNACGIRLARLASDREHLRETLRHELGLELTPEMLPAEPPESAWLEAESEAVAGLHARIEALGPVNMMALEEFQETEQRHQFLATQRQDLMDAIADTQKTIQELDLVTRKQFAEAFEKINIYFQETFQTLFGGGQGFLRLTDAENNPEGGVDIVAQPPGKKLQNALLLSGGEKAMTALALLIAVFRYQPSPFCVLDEVDAPLDEANISRFTRLIQEMSAQTQFVIITHSRRTMEIAPLLYGVTMPQSGVSRIVSVRMEEARRMAG